jgi:hypothetical protein
MLALKITHIPLIFNLLYTSPQNPLESENLNLYTDTMDKIQVSRDSFDKVLSIGNSRFREEVLPNLENERRYSVVDSTLYREIIDPIGK